MLPPFSAAIFKKKRNRNKIYNFNLLLPCFLPSLNESSEVSVIWIHAKLTYSNGNMNYSYGIWCDFLNKHGMLIKCFLKVCFYFYTYLSFARIHVYKMWIVYKLKLIPAFCIVVNF